MKEKIVLIIVILCMPFCVVYSQKNDTLADSNHNEIYKSVVIGNQIWLAENLNVDRFSNGDPIPHAQTNKEWDNAGIQGTPAWCYYNNDPANGEKYGKLYNWYAVNDPRGLAPEGWKIPSDEDWSTLTDFLGGVSGAGKKMKFTDFWADIEGNSGNGTNESGFAGLPSGNRTLDGRGFYNIGKTGFYWNSSEGSSSVAGYRFLNYCDNWLSSGNLNKACGFSVRCLRH